MVNIKAVIMAGGKGTRLRPLTCDIPKPMVPVINKPVMEYSINLLKKHGVKDIAVTMAYLPSVIVDYFGDGSEWGVNLHYFSEDVPLGTGGSVKNAEDFLDDTFVVVSGDALTDINIKKAVSFHKNKKSKATLILKKESVPLEYGVIITDDNDKIVRFLEKPSWGEVFSDTVNTGIYILEPEVLRYYDKNENFDFSKDLFPKLLKDNVGMYGYVSNKYWNDIGDLNSYLKTHHDIFKKKVNINIDNKETEEGVWIGEGTFIGNNVKINPPVYIGKNCIIKDSVVLDSYTYIGDNCKIGEKSNIKRSIIWKNSNIGKNTHCRGTAVCNNVQIKNRVNVLERSAIGKSTVVSDGVIIKPNIKIWPDKKIGINMIVNQNLVWGTKASKTIFGYKDISGEINMNITPEFTSRLGSAYASIMNDEDTIVVSRDCFNASEIIKNSMISGILSTGVGVIDIGVSAMPVTRFAVRHYDVKGGIHIRCNASDENRVHIEFVDHKGSNIDRRTERKIENLFNREDFERCNASKVKNVVSIENFSSFYIRNGSKIIDDISKVKRKNAKIFISSMSKNIIDLTSEFLQYIGCQVQYEHNDRKSGSVESYINYISNQVRKNNADIGMILSENGENLILIDERGRVIEKEMYTVLATLILLKIGSDNKIVIPYTSPKIIESMSEDYKVDIIRTKTSPSEIMNEMLKLDNGEKDVLLQYVLYFDAILAAGKIVDFMVQNSIALSELIDELPDYHFIKEEISCDWQDKGRVIREIIVEHKDKDIELFEGVKINNDKGWALILPDSERPIFNVYAEGFSEEYAMELSSFFSKKVKKLLEK